MTKITNEIADDIQTLIDFVHSSVGKEYCNDEEHDAADRLAVWLATFQPNHLTDKEDGD